jgi:hypothetical protein
MLVFAHEVGHNFGMIHDNACGTYCSASAANAANCAADKLTILAANNGGNYIMWPISVDGSTPNNFAFSPCSIYSASQVFYHE